MSAEIQPSPLSVSAMGKIDFQRVLTSVCAEAFNAPPLAWQSDPVLSTFDENNLLHVKRQQLAAFWNAPQTAHDWHILAAIHAAWDSMEAGQP